RLPARGRAVQAPLDLRGPPPHHAERVPAPSARGRVPASRVAHRGGPADAAPVAAPAVARSHRRLPPPLAGDGRLLGGDRPVMCGIAGIVSLTERPVARDEVASMCTAIVHRGPDD